MPDRIIKILDVEGGCIVVGVKDGKVRLGLGITVGARGLSLDGVDAVVFAEAFETARVETLIEEARRD